MKRIAHVARVSLVAALLTAGCSSTPTPSTPTPTPTPEPTPTPPSAVVTVSIAISPVPLHAGATGRFNIRVTGVDQVSALSLDFGDGTSATVGSASLSLDVSHAYRLPGTYNATVVATTSRGTSTSVVVVRVEP